MCLSGAVFLVSFATIATSLSSWSVMMYASGWSVTGVSFVSYFCLAIWLLGVFPSEKPRSVDQVSKKCILNSFPILLKVIPDLKSSSKWLWKTGAMVEPGDCAVCVDVKSAKTCWFSCGQGCTGWSRSCYDVPHWECLYVQGLEVFGWCTCRK